MWWSSDGLCTYLTTRSTCFYQPISVILNSVVLLFHLVSSFYVGKAKETTKPWSTWDEPNLSQFAIALGDLVKKTHTHNNNNLALLEVTW